MDAPDLEWFCFESDPNEKPEIMLAVWVKTYLTKGQQAEFKQILTDLASDGRRTINVSDVVAVINAAKFMTEE